MVINAEVLNLYQKYKLKINKTTYDFNGSDGFNRSEIGHDIEKSSCDPNYMCYTDLMHTADNSYNINEPANYVIENNSPESDKRKMEEEFYSNDQNKNYSMNRNKIPKHVLQERKIHFIDGQTVNKSVEVEKESFQKSELIQEMCKLSNIHLQVMEQQLSMLELEANCLEDQEAILIEQSEKILEKYKNRTEYLWNWAKYLRFYLEMLTESCRNYTHYINTNDTVWETRTIDIIRQHIDLITIHVNLSRTFMDLSYQCVRLTQENKEIFSDYAHIFDRYIELSCEKAMIFHDHIQIYHKCLKSFWNLL